ncbi:hypothetical protein B9Q06_10005 [Candidatus Marsarchaeota G2 archaeon ECH_B_2]|uniref:Uncharacterized protein n=3 Tax=Candidatus Marsarchaeota group 2 TaxID=2203771 RepID=A0A2R6B6D3_9ARCH|nr:MAG: hypothetical protein B9Q06_10005 [Candidatus Marsarchaeota G2 archaeon ECH_B_2]PSN98726.1 MAG: hypothetical protein B9Q07_08860 [Candidatus Marsarchaeota G2 archaeon ECH_B_3]PSO00675.1 MAG: hypothetical protein B9Q05_10200 [Candidatus Marsarchaeota G2 archaeon ECH_B_1]
MKVFKLSEFKTPTIMYREKDLLTNKIVREKELAFDYTEDFNVYLRLYYERHSKEGQDTNSFLSPCAKD